MASVAFPAHTTCSPPCVVGEHVLGWVRAHGRYPGPQQASLSPLQAGETVCRGSTPLTHAPLAKQKIKDKSIRNFKTATAELYTCSLNWS